MARPHRDSATTPRGDAALGRTSSGWTLPGGRRFRRKDKLVAFLRNNPGYVWKHRGYIKSQAEDELNLAGYNVDSGGGRMQQYEYARGQGKVLRVWEHAPKAIKAAQARARAQGTKIVKVKPPTAQAKKLPPVVKGPVTTPKGDVVAATGTPPGQTRMGTPKTTVPKKTKTGQTRVEQGASQGLFDLALRRLLGLDTSGGFKPLDATGLLKGLDSSTSSQTKMIRDQIADLDKQGAFNTGQLDKWNQQIRDHVERARGRGIEMTKGLGGALAGNNAAILGSIGGEAAIGASPAAQTAQQGQNTLAALGQVDAQFLGDMQPLIEGEGRALKARELARLGDVRKQYTQQMQQVGTQDNSKRAELAMQIAQINNQGRQQVFQNQAGVAETLAGLGLSERELSAKQQSALLAAIAARDAQTSRDRLAWARIDQGNARIFAGAQDDAVDNAAGQAKSIDQKIAGAQTLIAELNPDDYPSFIPGKLAPQGLVQDVVDSYRQYGADVTDPRVKKAIAAAIRSFGVRVDPRWGWQ